ncbi:hypothetical protein JQ581_34675 [Bradyrhizobium liaoningense]|uniref:hypothetical protein n=1 Tax=Bradyrhizobium liaoningense TaxID=43992 RepID=UPI001BA92A17|nr:hypothetical protein [Bradyrhizobium liaoningense]MBR0742094.1 hypothetical protein [Bradyrhizobium liaoningense]
MKRSILAAALMLMATFAQAGPITKLSSNGWWEVSYNASNRSGNPMCVMATRYDWANGTTGAVYVKWTKLGARWQIWRSDWRMSYGSTVPMSITFIDLAPDAPPPQTITADAKAITAAGLLSFDINKDDLIPFLKVVGNAEKMTIGFPQSDTQWTLMMDGSGNATASFEQCITELAAPPQPLFRTPPSSDDDIANDLLRQDRRQYHGPCACPYDIARNGSRCGGRSAYSRPGGATPLCYRRNITPEMIEKHRQRADIAAIPIRP